MTDGKSPIDHRDPRVASRPKRFAEIERREGGPGAKEMAMVKRPRAEDDAARAERFVDIERRSDD